MKKLILTMVMSMLTFGLAFAASWYLHPPQEVADGPDQQAVTAAADTASGPTAAVGKPVNPGDGTLPAAVRPRAASVEELVRLGLSLNILAVGIAHWHPCPSTRRHARHRTV